MELEWEKKNPITGSYYRAYGNKKYDIWKIFKVGKIYELYKYHFGMKRNIAKLKYLKSAKKVAELIENG